MRAPILALAVCLTGCTGPIGPTPARNAESTADDAGWPALPELDDDIIDTMVADQVAGLSACMARDGEVLWCAGYGQANPDTAMGAQATTPYMLASVSKAVAALAVMRAVEDGLVSLDQPINEVLPFAVVHPDAPGSDITLRHLMTHTSGIEDNWDALEPHYTTGDSPEVLGSFLADYLVPGGEDYDRDLNFGVDGVGVVNEYSNVGATLAAYVVEAATAVPFDDYCDAQLFEPLGLNAGWHLADFDPDEVAAPTQVQGGEFVTLPHYGFPDYPDGQLRADALSVTRLVAAVANGGLFDGVQVLPGSAVSEMVRVQQPSIDADQALFWYRWILDGDPVVGHNGGEEGVSTEVLYRLRDGLVLVVLMNSEGGDRTLEDIELAMLNAAGRLMAPLD